MINESSQSHKRIINQPKEQLTKLLGTLSTSEDEIWPSENWPRMKFKNGIKEGAKGGHGPIRYTVKHYDPNELIQFKFSKPIGFHGHHQFEVIEINKAKTELIHTIEMNTSGMGTLYWLIAIRWLHDALVEDALDKVESQFTEKRKRTEWKIWVKFLRNVMK